MQCYGSLTSALYLNHGRCCPRAALDIGNAFDSTGPGYVISPRPEKGGGTKKEHGIYTYEVTYELGHRQTEEIRSSLYQTEMPIDRILLQTRRSFFLLFVSGVTSWVSLSFFVGITAMDLCRSYSFVISKLIDSNCTCQYPYQLHVHVHWCVNLLTLAGRGWFGVLQSIASWTSWTIEQVERLNISDVKCRPHKARLCLRKI